MKSTLPRILPLFLFPFFYCCHSLIKQNKNTELQQVSDSSKSKNMMPIFRTYQFDTSDMAESTQSEEKSGNGYFWSRLRDFYSVYRFSKNIYGIGIALPDDTTEKLSSSIFLKALYATLTENPIPVDTLYHFSLYRKTGLHKILFSDTTRLFYIYCTKGLTTATISDVYYHQDACVYFMVFNLSHIDTAMFGQPLIASRKKIKLTYSNNKEFQRDLVTYDSLLKARVEYKDTAIIPFQFAYNDSLFFTYSDDFTWWKDTTFKCGLPGRSIYKIDGKKVSLKWGDYLELIGIPCD